MMKQKNVMQIPDVYKPSEFAKIAGVSVNTLQRWDREGRLTAYRTPAGRRYYTRKHVIEIKHSTPQEEEAWMKDEATLNLWLSPYPLKWLENGGVSRASRIGDDVAYLRRSQHCCQYLVFILCHVCWQERYPRTRHVCIPDRDP